MADDDDADDDNDLTCERTDDAPLAAEPLGAGEGATSLPDDAYVLFR